MKLKTNIYKKVTEAKLRTLGDLHVRDNFDITREIISMLRFHVLQDSDNWFDSGTPECRSAFDSTYSIRLLHKHAKLDSISFSYKDNTREHIIERIRNLLNYVEKALERDQWDSAWFQARVSCANQRIAIFIKCPQLDVLFRLISCGPNCKAFSPNEETRENAMETHQLLAAKYALNDLYDDTVFKRQILGVFPSEEDDITKIVGSLPPVTRKQRRRADIWYDPKKVTCDTSTLMQTMALV